MTLRKTLFTATVAGPALILALTGCSSAVSADDAQQSTGRAVAAIALSEAHVPGRAFELDARRGSWDLSVVSADNQVTELRTNEDGTEVTSSRNDGGIDLDDRRRIDGATVSMADAITTAGQQVTGLVREVDLERIRGITLVWAVTIDEGQDDIDVYINAGSGAVERIDRD